MTVVPLTPAAAPVPTPGAAAGSNPVDFLAQMLDALAHPALNGAGETPTTKTVPKAPTKPVLVEPAETPEGETPEADAQTQTQTQIQTPIPTTVPTTDPTLTALVAQHGLRLPVVAPSPGKPDDRDASAPSTTPPAAAPVDQGKHRGQVDNPGLHLGVDHTGHPVNPKHAASAAAPADKDATPPVVPAPPSASAEASEPPADAPVAHSSVAPAAPQVTAPPVGGAPVIATATPATTTPVSSAPSISDQVFDQVTGQVTSLATRGNGTSRITMKLQPEALGEVRVVLTMRAGAVHVRLAAG
ncbi:MAG: flagellar hook-length control protein FliK, partial [Marmoricola sp.]